MKKILLAALALGATHLSYAQLLIGPEAGLNLSNYIFKTSTFKLNSKYVPGLRAGIVADVDLGSSFYLQPSLMYMRNGTQYDIPDLSGQMQNINLRINTIELPVNFMYKLGTPRHGGLFIGAGVYFAFNINGTAKDNTQQADIKIGNPTDNFMRPLDVGAGLNVGYQFASGLFLRGSAQLGLTELNPSYANTSVKVHSNSFGITIGYLSGKPNNKPKQQPKTNPEPRKPKHKRNEVNSEY